MTQGFYEQPPTNEEAPLAQEAFQVRPSGGVPPRPLREALGHFSAGKAAGVVVLTVLAGILISSVPGGSLLVGF